MKSAPVLEKSAEAAVSRNTLSRSAGSSIGAPLPRPEGRRRFSRRLWGAAALLAAGAGVGGWWLWSRPWFNAGQLPDKARENDVPMLGFEVVKEYQHDRNAFTQGLIYHADGLYESTGHEGQSTVRRVELETGKVLEKTDLHPDYFGEGLALLDDELYQLTWKHGDCLVYDRKALKFRRRLRYQGEGWGLTFDGSHFILSDGSATLRFLDPKTFRVVKRVEVRMNDVALERLNELEFIDGEVWANVWYEDVIVRIDPRSGKVNSVLDLTRLWPRTRRPDENCVLNGIAHDASKGRLFVTGKYWPRLYEIRVVQK